MSCRLNMKDCNHELGRYGRLKIGNGPLDISLDKDERVSYDDLSYYRVTHYTALRDFLPYSPRRYSRPTHVVYNKSTE